MKNNSINVLYQILSNNNLSNTKFKYCLVNEQKLPFTIKGEIAKPNNVNDFFTIDEINEKNLKIFEKFVGIGISIQGSNICAIDVDKCCSIPFDINSINHQGKEIINLFKEIAYIEFSFSGTGLRILFNSNIPENYSKKYYIKNSKNNIEFYYPQGSFRYVTLTGKYIYNNPIIASKFDIESILCRFLDKYMVRQQNQSEIKIINNYQSKDIKKSLRKLILNDFNFQEVWFSKAPGSNSNESELDYYLIKSIYDNITNDKNKIKELFESSPYFKSKDKKHLNKWEYNNYRYYEYIYEHL